MKKSKILVSVILLLTIGLSKPSAAEKTTVSANELLLSEKIEMLLMSTPLEDLMCEKTERITVYFKVKKDHSLELSGIEGNNKKLIQYAAILLSDKSIQVDPLVEVKSYEMPIKFTLK